MSTENIDKEKLDIIKKIVKIGFLKEKDDSVELQGSGKDLKGSYNNLGVRIKRYYDKEKNYVYYVFGGAYVGETAGVAANIISEKSDLEEDKGDFFGPESGLTRQNRNMYLAEKELSKGHEEEDRNAEKIIRIGFCIGGQKAIANTISFAFWLKEKFDPEKNETILINALPLSNKNIEYFKNELNDNFNEIISRTIYINCVEDYISPMNENASFNVSRFYFYTKETSYTLGLNDKHDIKNLDLDNQVNSNCSYQFWVNFWNSVNGSRLFLGEENFYRVLHAYSMFTDKMIGKYGKEKVIEDVHGNEFKIQPLRIAIFVAILDKSYISAYFRSLSTGRRVLFGFGVLSSVCAVAVACANVFTVGFLLAFPQAALIAAAVTLGCVGLVSMISSFVGINWREPVEESKAEIKQISEKEVNEQEQEKEEKDINEQNIGNVQMENCFAEGEKVEVQAKNKTFVEQKLNKTNVDEKFNENNEIPVQDNTGQNLNVKQPIQYTK